MDDVETVIWTAEDLEWAIAKLNGLNDEMRWTP